MPRFPKPFPKKGATVSGDERTETTAMIEPLFAWISAGHAELTTIALGIAIARLVLLPKAFLLGRLRTFAAIESAIQKGVFGAPGYPPTDKAVNDYLQQIEGHSPTVCEQDLVLLFDDLPSRVEEEDLHAGNIPKLGKFLDKDGQVRHYMRSSASIPAAEAQSKSRAYIWNNLYWSWWLMRKAVFHEKKWYDFINDCTIDDFDAGVGHLAKALHTIEDSYSPAHVKRRDGTGIIEDIHAWDDENTNPDPARGWLGHEAYDNPHGTDESRRLFQMAKVAVGGFVTCVLSTLDQDQAAYVQQCGNLMNNNFASNF